MMSMLNLLWIVPLVSAVAWGWGYKANPERVKAFVKAHIVDEDPYQDEGHSATRYAPEPGESPIAREARKAAEVGITPEEMSARLINSRDPDDYDDKTTGICDGVPSCSHCFGCSGDGRGKTSAMVKEEARNWLLDHGINPDEASK